MIQADDRLKAIFDDAIKIARSNKHEYITLEHLLMIMIQQPEIEEMCKNHQNMNLQNLRIDLDNHIKEKMNDIKTKDEVYPKRTQTTDRAVNRAFTTAIFQINLNSCILN